MFWIPASAGMTLWEGMKKIVLALLIFVIAAGSTATVINIPGDYPTIQQGIDASSSGDTVLVATGTYYENLIVSNHDMVLASNFIFDGNPTTIENTVIDGGNVSTVITVDDTTCFTAEIYGLSITNGFWYGDWPNVRGGGIHAGDSVQVKIGNCYIHDNLTVGYINRGGGIYLNSSNSIISDCVFYGNESTMGPAIAIGEHTNNVLIERCNIYNNACAVSNPAGLSIISISLSSDITVSRSVIHHNGGSGIRNYSSSNTSVINCTIANNSGYGINNIYFDSDIYVLNTISAFNNMGNLLNSDNFFSVAVCEYSDIIDGTGQPWFNEGCIDADPLFEDTSQNNYHLMSASPCIDAGHPDSPLDPDGTTADIGALYFDQTTNLEEKAELPSHSILLDNYPNPFNAQTIVRFFLSAQSSVSIAIYNILGQEVGYLYGGLKPPGSHTILWNAGDLPSGIYFARLKAGNISKDVKMILLK